MQPFKTLFLAAALFIVTAARPLRSEEVKSFPEDERVSANDTRTPAELGQKSVNKAQTLLSEKISALAREYAKGPESTENIGHAIAFHCSAEIDDLVERQARNLRISLVGDDAETVSNKWRIENIEKTRSMVWRAAVAAVVDLRTQAASKRAGK